MVNAASGSPWVPKRQDIIWIDCSPQAGQEMRHVHPFLVLSPEAFNDRTSLVIGLPMTTQPYNADNPFALPVGEIHKNGIQKVSYVLCHQPKSFDWRVRNAGRHPLKKMPDEFFDQACTILNQILTLA
ncbi:type II toxin-antitoxin system PemK/MazF family toxin [Desulfoplanes sp.]